MGRPGKHTLQQNRSMNMAQRVALAMEVRFCFQWPSRTRKVMHAGPDHGAQVSCRLAQIRGVKFLWFPPVRMHWRKNSKSSPCHSPRFVSLRSDCGPRRSFYFGSAVSGLRDLGSALCHTLYELGIAFLDLLALAPLTH